MKELWKNYESIMQLSVFFFCFHTLLEPHKYAAKWRLAGLPYSRLGARIIIRIIRRSNTMILSAQSHNYLGWACKKKLDFLTYIFFSLDYYRKINKSGFLIPKFLISVLSWTVNCEKLIPCRYILQKLLFFMFISRLQLLKRRQAQIWLQNRWINLLWKNPSSKTLEKVIFMFISRLQLLKWRQAQIW